MGSVPNIGMYCFPKQGSYLGQRVTVCFHYDTEVTIGGEIVRDDAEQPGVAIIKLDDGRHVLTTECMWTTAR
ncbi:hypothetical protein [Mycolicibacterium goodii]|uniref:hypothetical protein n=1 Tax=Mycolicibacterium goodii TaxID=134601 RepID=UPI001BDD4EC6|nr:hypothetical protein [Mycolicibacterium goodii]MBU8834399.1 hypothetical protein [Mycolicibacterium goodii]UVT31614.1 hypothetical protein SEA_MASK_81 [Mycobacterium phage Mask]